MTYDYDRARQAHSLDTEFWGTEGAGCVPYAEDTGRICLQKRSSGVNEPNTWGVFGGAMDDDESPLAAVRRELEEETGYGGKVRFEKLHVFSKADFRFHNFLAIVPRQFAPKHSWESSGHAWVTLDDLPSPLHFGVKSLLPSLTKYVESLQEGGVGSSRGVEARFSERQALVALPVNFALYFKSIVRKTEVDILRMKKNVSLLLRARSEHENEYDDILRDLRFRLSEVEEVLIPRMESFLQRLQRAPLERGIRVVKMDLGLENFEENQGYIVKFAEQSVHDVTTIMKDYEVPEHLVQAYMECITISQALVTRALTLRARLDSYRPGSEDNEAVSPPFEKLEKLYHASIKARALYQHGFGAKTPGRGTGLGLGGSVEDGAGNGAVSFTSDLRYAHEIARWLKEMALVARGDIKALNILKVSEKEGNIEKTIDNFMGINGRVGDRMHPEGETYLIAENGRFRVINLKWVPEQRELVEEVGDLDVLVHSKRAIYTLYEAYLNASPHRDNPMFIETDALLNRLEKENVDPRDIGVIVAEIDMTDPDIRYVVGEQEYRVPPRSIKKVVRFM